MEFKINFILKQTGKLLTCKGDSTGNSDLSEEKLCIEPSLVEHLLGVSVGKVALDAIGGLLLVLEIKQYEICYP